MNTGHRSIDELLRAGLARRAAGASGDLVALILDATDSTSQRRVALGFPRFPRRLTLVLAIVLLLAALGGALAVGSWLLREDVPLPLPRANGEIVTQGAGCELVAVDPVTGATRPFEPGIPDCYPTYSEYNLAWSPQGDRLAAGYFFFCGGCGSPEAQRAVDGELEGVWLLEPGAGLARQLVRCSVLLSSPPRDGCWPTGVISWSPSGDSIAYVADDEVWVVPIDSGEPRQVSEGLGSSANVEWSPISDRVAYQQGPGTIMIATPDGSERLQVFQTLDAIRDLSWAPDGESILVSVGQRNGSAVLSVPIDGSPSHVEAQFNDATAARHARWSPDGTHLAFGHLDLGATTIEVWTGAQRKSFTLPGIQEDFSDLAWSPDSRYLTFSFTARNADAGSAITWVVSVDGSGSQLLAGDRTTVPAWRPVSIGSP